MYNFKSKTNIPEFELSTENYTLVFSFMHQCADFFVESQEKKYIYHNIEPGIDVIYYLEQSKIKENIIIWNKENLVDKLSLSISSKDPIIFYFENKELQVRSISGEVLFILDKPFITDIEDKNICKCDIEYEQISDRKYILNIKLGNILYSLNKNQFPLIIDPSILFSDNKPTIMATNIYGPPVMTGDQVSVYAFQGNGDKFPVNIFKGVQVIGTVPLYAHPELLDNEEKYQSFINNRGLDSLDIYFTFITNRETGSNSVYNRKLLYDIIPENPSAIKSLSNEADFVGNIGRTSVYRGLWSIHKQALPNYSDGLHSVHTRFAYSGIYADMFLNLPVNSTRKASFLKFNIDVINEFIDKYMHFMFASYLSLINFSERMSTWRENRPTWEPEIPGNVVVHKYMLPLNIWDAKKTTNLLDFRFNFTGLPSNIIENIELSGCKLSLTKYSEINLAVQDNIDNKVVDKEIHLALFELGNTNNFIAVDPVNIAQYSPYDVVLDDFVPPRHPWPEMEGTDFPTNKFIYGSDFSTMGIILLNDPSTIQALGNGLYDISVLLQANLIKNSDSGGEFYAFIRNHVSSNVHADSDYKPQLSLVFSAQEVGWANDAIQYNNIPATAPYSLEGTIGWANSENDQSITNIEGKYESSDPPIIAPYKMQSFQKDIPKKTKILQFEFANNGIELPIAFANMSQNDSNYTIVGYKLSITRGIHTTGFTYDPTRFEAKDEFIQIYIHQEPLGQSEGTSGENITIINTPTHWGNEYNLHTKHFSEMFAPEDVKTGNRYTDRIYARYQASLTYIDDTGWVPTYNDFNINLYEFELNLIYKIEISKTAYDTKIVDVSSLPDGINYFDEDITTIENNELLTVENMNASLGAGENNWTIIEYLDTEEAGTKNSIALMYYFDFVGTEVEDLSNITGIELIIQKQAYYNRQINEETVAIKDAYVKIGIQDYTWVVPDDPTAYKIAWASDNKAKEENWKLEYKEQPDQEDEQVIYGSSTDNWGKLWDIDQITSTDGTRNSLMCATIVLEMTRMPESVPSIFACIDNIKMKIYGNKDVKLE